MEGTLVADDRKAVVLDPPKDDASKKILSRIIFRLEKENSIVSDSEHTDTTFTDFSDHTNYNY